MCPGDGQEVSLLLPGNHPTDMAGDCTLDPEKAQRAIEFFPLFLKHNKGKWSQESFRLADWQTSVIANMFGWVRPDGTRRYRTSLIEVPRKAGKSHLCAGLALYCLLFDSEPGAEVYCAAADRDQASIVFAIARKFIEADEYLSERCKIYRNAIVVPETSSTMKPLSSDSRSAHGLNASTVVADELHVWTKPDARDLWEALVTSQGARTQPLTIAITTAGTSEPSIWLDVHTYAQKVRDGEVDDMTFLPAIWAAEKDDAWDDPDVWHKANPGLGVTIDVGFYERECARAKALPSYANAFRRLYLNQQTVSMDRWLNMVNWDECGDRMTEQELQGRQCFAGLDLSSTLDLTALVLVFPRSDEEGKGYDVLSYFFVPEENMIARQRDDGVPYVSWAESGDLIATPGDVVDYAYVRQKINDLGECYDIREIALDRWNATQVAVWLEQDGFDVAFFGQGYRSMSAPSKELEASVMGRRLRHGGQPVLRWNASVCSHESDAAGNVKPSKKKSGERIDGIVATVMGIGRATSANEGASSSVYEDRGLETL